MSEVQTGNKGGFWVTTRIVWAPLIVVGVGLISGFTYPRTGLGNFYATTAQVVVTLYIAMVVGAIASRGVRNAPALTVEHWILLVVSCAGLLASIRAVSTTQVHPWLTGLSVAGLVAILLVVAENLISWRAVTQWAWLWSSVFIAVVIVLVLVPV